MYADAMRTTIDIPDDVHARIKAVATSSRQSFGTAAVAYLRRGMSADMGVRLGMSPRTGLTTVILGHPVTSEDVYALEDDE